jgi:hypothetical protein
MLLLAKRNQEDSDSKTVWAEKSHGRVYLSEVAEVYYGWQPTKRDKWGIPKFSKIEIPNYMAGKVALFKAARRLERRGLIKIGGRYGQCNYFYATDEGKSLMAKPREEDPGAHPGLAHKS